MDRGGAGAATAGLGVRAGRAREGRPSTSPGEPGTPTHRRNHGAAGTFRMRIGVSGGAARAMPGRAIHAKTDEVSWSARTGSSRGPAGSPAAKSRLGRPPQRRAVARSHRGPRRLGHACLQLVGGTKRKPPQHICTFVQSVGGAFNESVNVVAGRPPSVVCDGVVGARPGRLTIVSTRWPTPGPVDGVTAPRSE
jgi:hypothetical protein